MCDTFYISRNTGETAFFAKNSDRDPNEPQYMHFIPEGHQSEPGTYVKMSSYEVKHHVWLSRPSWMWGGEMGVNQKGVAIGNEATFNKVKVPKKGVLGMDHLRIALELASTAKEALDILIINTEKHGQGGNGGFEHPIYYHNSYLITDPYEAYVLDTVGRDYAYKKFDVNLHISNKICLKDNFDAISPNLEDRVKNFEKHFTNPLVTYFAGAYHRENRGRKLLERKHWAIDDVISLLKDRHTGKVASMRNISMIAGGIISSQATASFFYDYSSNVIWYTEGPCPEIQLFKPLKMKFFRKLGTQKDGVQRWKRNNLLFRAVLKDFKTNKEKIHELRESYQQKIFELSSSKIQADEVAQIHKLNNVYLKEALKIVGPSREFKTGGPLFSRYWKKENKALIEKEEEDKLKTLYEEYFL